MFQQESDPYQAAKHTGGFLQNRIVKVLEIWTKGQTLIT